MPPPSSTPTDFTNELDRDETFLETGRSYLFELTAETGSATRKEMQVHLNDGADASQPTEGLYIYNLKKFEKALASDKN